MGLHMVFFIKYITFSLIHISI